MPILTQCPHCQKKFRAPDNLAGKAVKCPGCQGAVRVTQVEEAKTEAGSARPSSDSWYILTESREQMGPVSKEQLDNLATKGRLGFCQIRRSDWRAWKWADDVYPDLPASKREDKSTGTGSKSPEQPAATLVICPDCGNTVSRRATQCPHCGCPAAVLMKQDASSVDGPLAVRPPAPKLAADPKTEPGLDDGTVTDGPKKSTSQRLVAVIAGVVILLVGLGGVGWWWTNRSPQPPLQEFAAEQPDPPPEPEEPSEELLSPDGKTKCIDEAARAWAGYIDEVQRKHHLPLSMLSQSAESVKMLEELARGNMDAIPDSTSSIPGGAGVEPYEPQADKLFIECRNWVRDNVKRGACTEEEVWQTARLWAQEKQKSILKPLGGISIDSLTPDDLPERP